MLPISKLPPDFFPLTCRTCVDYTNVLADITVGYMGGQGEQWLLVRNERGEELLALLGDEIRTVGAGQRRQAQGPGERASWRTSNAPPAGCRCARMPDWLRPIVGWLMPRIGPRGLEFARARVEMKAVETVAAPAPRTSAAPAEHGAAARLVAGRALRPDAAGRRAALSPSDDIRRPQRRSSASTASNSASIPNETSWIVPLTKNAGVPCTPLRSSAFDLLAHALQIHVVGQFGIEARQVEFQMIGIAAQLVRLEVALILEQQVVHRPEPVLCCRGFRGLGCEQCVADALPRAESGDRPRAPCPRIV